MNGVFERGKLTFPRQDQRLFNPLPRLVCRVVDRTSHKKLRTNFICPLYRCAFVADRINPDLVAMYDGETDNYVMDVYLPTEISDGFWLLNNLGLYCQAPPNLV
jgi:hypothetical protein